MDNQITVTLSLNFVDWNRNRVITINSDYFSEWISIANANSQTAQSSKTSQGLCKTLSVFWEKTARKWKDERPEPHQLKCSEVMVQVSLKTRASARCSTWTPSGVQVVQSHAEHQRMIGKNQTVTPITNKNNKHGQSATGWRMVLEKDPWIYAVGEFWDSQFRDQKYFQPTGSTGHFIGKSEWLGWCWLLLVDGGNQQQ